MTVGAAAEEYSNITRLGALALLALAVGSCASTATTEAPLTSATARSATPETPTTTPQLGAPGIGVNATAGQDLPATGSVAVSGSVGGGCGILAGGQVRCWGHGRSKSPPGGVFTAVSAAGSLSCGLRVGGSMECWGPRLPPGAFDEGVPWPPAGEFVALSGDGPMCALRRDGSLTCSILTWGEDDDQTPGGLFVAVSVASDFACGIRPDLTLECWGSNLASVGSGDVVSARVDVGKARPPEGAFVAVSAGWSHACGVRASGEIACWGSDLRGEMWDVPAGEFTAVTSSSHSSCGLRRSGELACWGAEAPRNVPEGRFVALSPEGFCGLRPDGNVECWAANRRWRNCQWLLASYSPFDTHFCYWTPLRQDPSHGALRALPPAGEYVALSARKGYTCGLTAVGEARCWGLFFSGEAEPPPGLYTAITTGWFHACGLRPNGAAICWGDPQAPPPQSPPGTFAKLSAGWEYTCGVRLDGSVECWGREPGCAPIALLGPRAHDYEPSRCWNRADAPPTGAPAGTRGSSPGLEPRVPPSPVPGVPAGTFAAVAAGAAHACALSATDGSAVCWGDDFYGQTDAPPGEFTTLSAGYAHTCALGVDGTAACWGNDNIGQSTPPPGTFTQITAGEWHTCAMRADGEAECWGGDRHRIGSMDLWNEFITPWALNNTVAISDARPAPPPGPYTTLAAGNFHTCAIRTDRGADCWGHSS